MKKLNFKNFIGMLGLTIVVIATIWFGTSINKNTQPRLNGTADPNTIHAVRTVDQISVNSKK